MNKKISLGAAISLMALTAAIAITLTAFFVMNSLNVSISDFSSRAAMFKKLSEVDSLVRSKYVGSINETTLTDSTISGYVAGINDKYGCYLNVDDCNSIKLSNQGKSIGIGVNVVKSTDGYIKVVSVIKDSPAESSGIKVNDIINTIQSKDVKATGYTNAVNLLKGDEGTTATFTVLRNKVQLSFDITRKKFNVSTVSSERIGNIGYIKISEFSSNTASEFSSQVDTLTAAGVKGLIFDVRNNPGGHLESCAKMIDKIVPAGPIVRSKDKNGTMKTLYTSGAGQVDLPIVVITNENSASAAELFTAALKDYNKAVCVGTKTYGKGTMQEICDLSDGTALDLSVAYFYPPKSDNFEGKGVMPDIPVTLSDEKLQNYYSLTMDEDDQLQSAISQIESKIE
jgi:carboxyl-terminal processing protease